MRFNAKKNKPSHDDDDALLSFPGDDNFRSRGLFPLDQFFFFFFLFVVCFFDERDAKAWRCSFRREEEDDDDN